MTNKRRAKGYAPVDPERNSRGVWLTLAAVIIMAGAVGGLAFLDRGNIGKPVPKPTGSGNSSFITTRTLYPQPSTPPSTYFTSMRENWQSTWDKSEDAAHTTLCTQWKVDPITVLEKADFPTDLPINIDNQMYAMRLGDFFMEKCGTPDPIKPSPSPTPAAS